ncbi:DUF4198 domain-containing protein [Morganella morganii]|uniref:DUF4198 domain-containing protein n=1 Tax=Morganella morganii TaxID=582 RepID=UPI00339C94E8
MSLKKMTLISAALLFGSFQANAHNIWIEQTDGSDYVVRFGHNPTEKYPENKLKPVQAVMHDGKVETVSTTFKDGEAYFVMPENASIILLGYDNGVWSKLKNGRTVEKNKIEVPDAEFSKNPIKFSKNIVTWDDNATKVFNTPYELVPMTKPVAGQEFEIKALKDGQPLEGMKIAKSEEDPGVLTNKDGLAKFKAEKGANKVYAEYKLDTPDNKEYGFQQLEYVLSFDAE